MVSLTDKSIQDFYESLANGLYKSIVVVLGAGVSVSAGIPDFRSPGGLFETVQKHFGERFPDLMIQPEILLSRKFYNENPEVCENEVEPMLRNWKLEEANPTISHKMLGWLYKQGWLKRVYTQNIDGLELHQDVILETQNLSSGYKDCIIQSHGSMRDGSVVFYDDPLPEKFYKTLENDFKCSDSPVDLILVMGTTLQVSPFCAIPNLAPESATRVLVDPYPNRVISSNPWTIKIDLAGRQVELYSLWKKEESRWENELLIESTSDNFVEKFFESPTALKNGFSLLATKIEKVEIISKGQWHLCDIISKNNDIIKVRRCKDGKIAKVSIKKTKEFRDNLVNNYNNITI